MCWFCLGDALKICRWCLGFASVMCSLFEWCLSVVPVPVVSHLCFVMSWWCFGDVSVISRLCFVCVSWMIRWYLRDVSVSLWWCVKIFSACASDVLVIFKWCVGDVSGVSRWCVVIVLWCFGDMWVMPWFCVGDVSALCRWCFGVSVMGGDAVVMFWWWYCDVNSVMNIDEHFQFSSGFRSKKSGCSMCLCYWGRMLWSISLSVPHSKHQLHTCAALNSSFFQFKVASSDTNPYTTKV